MFELIYYFIPGYLANTVPVFAAKLFPRWNAPMDFGKKWRGKRFFGANKTWRGFITGTVIAGLAFMLQQSCLPLAGIPYAALPIWTGFLIGFGVLFGDCVESCIKRQLGKPPGSLFFPWDQIDYTLGAWVLIWCLWWPGWTSFFLLLLINALLTNVAHMLGYWLGLCKDRW